jgi:hypothetical protein
MQFGLPEGQYRGLKSVVKKSDRCRCELKMSDKSELLIAVLSWLLVLGLVAALIGEAIR